MLSILNDKYHQDIVKNRLKKSQEKESLAMEYSDFMKINQQKQQIGKII